MKSLSTLILLPGMLGTADLFASFLQVVPSDWSTRIISYPCAQPLSYAGLLDFIEVQLQDEHNMVILGESFAGPLALEFAAAHPNRVRAVILSASFVLPPLPSWLRWLATPALLRVHIPIFMIRFFVAGKDASENLIEQIRQALRVPTPTVLSGRIKQALTVHSIDALKRCRVPILYLAPNQDRLVWQSNLRTILEVRPDVQVAVIPGPHLILQAAPAAAWHEINHFLRSIHESR
jgi:pimeloyl-[acyl-carrier protein] methyl ester esterase